MKELDTVEQMVVPGGCTTD